MAATPSPLDIARLPRIIARQWWSAARLREWQSTRLTRLVKNAYVNVPFYRARWNAAGVSPGDVCTVDDLVRLPVVEAAEFKRAPAEDVLAANLKSASRVVFHTSGSTGQPLEVVYLPAERFVAVKAMSVRHYLAHGIGVRDKLASFSPDAQAGQRGQWYERLGFWRRLMLSSTAEASEWIEPLCTAQPDVIAGSPISLRELMDELRASGARIPAPRIIFSSGARLEHAERDQLEAELGAPVYDVYGAHEAGFVAWQCPVCPGYHVNVDTVIVEVLDGRNEPVEPGGTGEIVITNLFSSAMPFIRYKLGDIVTLSKKQPMCERSLPLLEQIWGRNDDVIRLPSGRKVGVYPIYMCILGNSDVREWRLVQAPDGNCTLYIVPQKAGDDVAAFRPVEEKLRGLLAGEVSLSTEVVNRIERERNTKWKTVVSSVSP